MTIEIYTEAVSDVPLEVHEWAGTIGEFLRSEGHEWEGRDEQPVVVFFEDVEMPATEWNSFEVGDRSLKVKIVPHFVDPISWLYVAFAALTAISLLTRPGMPGKSNTPQGRNLQTAEAKGNVAKPNQTVPELLGRFIRYPDYLVPPRRYFADQRTQYLETLLCVGPGLYDINGQLVKVGNTPFAGLAGAEFHIYGPGENVAAHGMHQNWYSSPEVGGTSAGTAGLELSSEPVTSVQPSGTLSFSGTSIEALAGWPDSIGTGTNVSVLIPLPCVVTTEFETGPEGPVAISNFSGNFSEFEPLSAGKLLLLKAGSSDVRLRVKTVSGTNPSRQVRFEVDTTGEGTWANYTIAPGAGIVKFRTEGRQYQITSSSGDILTVKALLVDGSSVVDDPTWISFPAISTTAAASEFTVTGGNVYGKWQGPYVACPVGEASQSFDLDFFFPSGLGKISDDGSITEISVQVEIQHRVAGSGSEWVNVPKTYAAATLDQIGFTERISVASAQRPEFRVRRASALSTDTRTNDKVQWYAMRTLLQSPTSYEGWTTIAIRIKGLGDLGTNSENRINLIATRLLPELQSDGTWTAPQPTRDISAAFRHIVKSVGYDDSQLDIEEMKRLHDIWRERGETLDNVFDQTTVRSALEVCMNAGMAEMTLSDGLLTPSREGVRTQFDGPPFSSQNVIGDITRSFTLRRPDDNDGVQIEYTDEEEDFATKTIDCKLPASPGLKLQKVKLEGVTSKTRAWRNGMRRAREIVYRRWSYSMQTELDALVARRGDYVALVPDIPDFGQSSIVEDVQGTVITSSEKLKWIVGANHVVAWRLPSGAMVGPFSAAKVSDYKLNVTVPGGTAMPEVTLRMEPAHLFFGTTEDWCLPALVTAVRPQSEYRVQLQAVNYDARIYADDDNQPE